MSDLPTDSFESVLSRHPFVVRRKVRWSDCDPAGVVYTGRFPEFVLSANNLFYSELAQGSWREWLKGMAVDTPCKGMEFEFHGALWPDDEFLIRGTVSAIRKHSYDIRYEAAQADGRRIFSARFSPICISNTGKREGVPIPDAMRARLQDFS
ncbi:MAG: acyl-CoA thioesterase [Pseudomonadota bacterium]